MNVKKIDEMMESIIRESTRRWHEDDDVVDDISIIIAYFS